MKLHAYIAATLAANVSDLTEEAILLAARCGGLPALLKAGLDTDSYSAYSLDWAAIWAAHTDAGHAQPEYDHTSDDDVASENGAVWGIDRLTVCGLTHEIGWCGCYGGEHGGKQYGWGGAHASQWEVYEDGEGVSRDYCIAAYAEHYGLDLTDGQPAKPSRDDCQPERWPATTAYVVGDEGEVTEVAIYRHSHPHEVLQDSRGNDIAPSASPYPSYYAAEDSDEQHDTAAEAIAALPGLLATEDEDEATAYALTHLAERVTAEVIPASDYSLHIPGEGDDWTPYVVLDNEIDEEGNRYHLDADELRLVLAHGWAALTPALAEAWGKRALIGALRQQQQQADQSLATAPQRVWVSLTSSVASGNCRIGTAAFARRHSIDLGAVGAVRADVLLAMEPRNPHLLRACRMAALGIH